MGAFFIVQYSGYQSLTIKYIQKFLWIFICCQIPLKNTAMMNPDQIASAQVLDILFEGRNKTYGAYQLRKEYNHRLGISIAFVLMVSVGILVSSFYGKKDQVLYNSGEAKEVILISDPTVKQPKKEIAPPAQRIASRKFTSFLVIKDNLFKKDTIPTIGELQGLRISTMSNAGDTVLSDAPALPIAATIQKPAVVVNEPVIYEHPEKSAGFPGGPDAWRRYLERNLQYPEEAIEAEVQGTISVQFIVDENGNISEVSALNDPGSGLAAAASKIISNGPKWTPAEQDGHPVISRHIQKIQFRLN